MAMDSIRGINPIAPAPSIGGLDKADGASVAGKEFGDMFAEAVGRVDQYRVKAENSANAFMAALYRASFNSPKLTFLPKFSRWMSASRKADLSASSLWYVRRAW